jgi:ABC-type cobalt transport system substrate-binding protein
MQKLRKILIVNISAFALLILAGCTTKYYTRSADKEAYKIIAETSGW